MGNNAAGLGEKGAVKGKELNSKALPAPMPVFLRRDGHRSSIAGLCWAPARALTHPGSLQPYGQ